MSIVLRSTRRAKRLGVRGGRWVRGEGLGLCWGDLTKARPHRFANGVADALRDALLHDLELGGDVGYLGLHGTHFGLDLGLDFFLDEEHEFAFHVFTELGQGIGGDLGGGDTIGVLGAGVVLRIGIVLDFLILVVAFGQVGEISLEVVYHLDVSFGRSRRGGESPNGSSIVLRVAELS